MSNENKTVRPIEPLMQMTLAGNLVILDPVTRREQFFEANEAHNRFTNAKGQEFTLDELARATAERLRHTAEQHHAGQQPETRNRFCQYCGKPLVEGDHFCRHCGKKIE